MITLLLIFQFFGIMSYAEVDPTQWVAVDGLGRKLPTNNEVKGIKEGKYVGIFYWTWHYNFVSNTPHNITEIMKEHPEIKYDYKNKLWSKYSAGSYFWNEPIYGYYTSIDKYVLRKQAEMLADAGVDFVAFDCTNGSFTWEPAYMAVCEVWSEAREQGVKTPQIIFMLNFGSTADTITSLKSIYKKLYKEEKYKDLWFYWEGKPLIMAHPEKLNQSVPLEKEIFDFFTWRRNVASYFEKDKDDRYWGWLHIHPQAVYKNADGTVEQVTVGIAQNADYVKMELSAMNGEHNMGRSYTNGEYSYSYTYRGKTINVDKNIENSMFYGLNFQQQWDFAIEQDPEIVFVTGWNEWIMGRFEVWQGVPNAFPDQFDDENSRDIEPSKGLLKDYYYYQLIDNIRRFKGANPINYAKEGITIDINGDLSQWDNPSIISYDHYSKNTYERKQRGWGKLKYENYTMRNDIINTKVTYDDNNIYFYVKTLNNLTPHTDNAWMRLFLDTSEATENSVDWEEIEYVINRTSPSDTEAVLEKSTGGWNWEEVGKVKYKVTDNVLQIEVTRKMLGFEKGKAINFNFKWSDNMQEDDIMDFYVNGDVAPGGRLMFPFRDEKAHEAEKDKGGLINQLKLSLIIFAGTGVVLIAGIATAVIISKKSKVA